LWLTGCKAKSNFKIFEHARHSARPQPIPEPVTIHERLIFTVNHVIARTEVAADPECLYPVWKAALDLIAFREAFIGFLAQVIGLLFCKNPFFDELIEKRVGTLGIAREGDGGCSECPNYDTELSDIHLPFLQLTFADPTRTRCILVTSCYKERSNSLRFCYDSEINMAPQSDRKAAAQ